LAEREQEVIRLHKQQIEIEKGLAESPKTPQEELQAFKGIEAKDVMLDITPEEAELLLKDGYKKEANTKNTLHNTLG